MVMYMSTTATLGQLADMVDRFTPDERLPHDPYVLVALEEALAAASDGNFGVGACLVDPRGQVVACGHNRVFHPYPRSDLHAEMDTMTRFETQHPDIMSLRQYTLFTSLEPCPMCLTRLITAGVGHVYYAVPDPEGGMVCKLPRPDTCVGRAGPQAGIRRSQDLAPTGADRPTDLPDHG